METNNINNEKKVANAPLLRFPEFKEEWQESSLNDIADFSKGQGISKDQRSDIGSPCILYGELYTTYSSEIIDKVFSKTNIDSTKLVKSKANDIIIPASGETAIDIATARCVKHDNVLLGGDLNIIRMKDDNNLGDFFCYELNGIRRFDIAQIAQGVSVVHLHASDLKGINVRFPSFQEQRKIANFLSLLDKRIEIQKSVIEKLKSLKSAIVDKMLVCNGPSPRIKYNKFLENWIGYRLDEILEKIENGVTYDTNETQGYPVTRIETISSGKINYFKVGYCSDYSRVEKHKLLKGDILLSHINSIPYIGKTAYYNGEQQLYHGMNVLLLRCRVSINPLFFYYMLNTQWFLKKCKILAKQAVNQASISISDLRNIIFKLPSFKEQTQIAQSIKSFDNKIEIEELLLRHLQEQKSHLLSKMFI